MRVNGKEINQMRAAERCPEKAGVGGSSPSLATTFIINDLGCGRLPSPIESATFPEDKAFIFNRIEVILCMAAKRLASAVLLRIDHHNKKDLAASKNIRSNPKVH